MKVTLVVDGERREVEVDLAGGSATVGDRSFPVRVVSSLPNRVDLEIAGEKVTVDGWPSTVPSPSEPVGVNGERFRVEVTVAAGPAVHASARVPPPSPSGSSGPGAAAEAGPGVVLPPMPGRVVELRVRVGDRVTRGQVLLVLEAMKMRNEIASPSDGQVAEVHVAPGANVRAKEPLLRIVPAT